MDDELNHILCELGQCHRELEVFSKVWLAKDEDFTEDNISKAKRRFRISINELLSYTRALRDKLENG